MTYFENANNDGPAGEVLALGKWHYRNARETTQRRQSGLPSISLGPTHVVQPPTGRLGCVDVDRAGLLEARPYYGSLDSMGLTPPGSRIVRIEHMQDTGNTRLYFTKDSLRELSNGELIPRYTQKFADTPDGEMSWWEEVQ